MTPFIMVHHRVLPFLCFATPALAALELSSYGNVAIHGTPASVGKVADLEMALPIDGSLAVSGSLVFPSRGFYAFNCSYSGGQLVFVWLADHLVCHTDPPFGTAPHSNDGSIVNPLMAKAVGDTVPIVVHVYSASLNNSGAATSGKVANVSIRWAHLAEPQKKDATVQFEPIPPSSLLTATPPIEIRRRELQESLKRGWNTWSYNMLGIVRLPQSFALITAICQLSAQRCLTETHIEDPHAEIRVGVFAADQSFWQFYVGFAGINVSLSVTGGDAALHVLAEPLGCAGGVDGVAATNCSDYALVVLPRYWWFRLGEVADADGGGGVAFSAHGVIGSTVVRPTTASVEGLPLPQALNAFGPHRMAFSLGAGAIGLREDASRSAGGAPTLSDVRAHVEAARRAEYARYSPFGELADAKEALQAATLWNYIYTPAELGPVLPVSRQWNFVHGQANLDWGYVVFDWDNIFASYMTSLEPASKAIAYSNFIQVIRSKTAAGFVPNFSAGGTKSADRTEPPIGAKVLLEMYAKYKDAWLVELLFDDLLEWNDWFLRSRALGPVGLLSLGSDTIDGLDLFSPGSMQGARFESGLDNSPMYDGSFFQANVTSIGSRKIGQMQLYDVGMASMFVQEAEALAKLAPVAGKSASLSSMLSERARAQRELIQTHLWDAQGGIFTNRWWNGSFYRRITPTSFYAMLAGAASDEQAATMVSKWLLSPEHFCVAPTGDFAGNHDDCYWGLPSVQRADAAFPPLGYWRGYVWGPMAQLTYWSLQRYDHVPVVRTARKALCKQMTALMLSQWRLHRHICENYSPHRTADDHNGDCSGTKFYHWGALNAMITMVEEGYY